MDDITAAYFRDGTRRMIWIETILNGVLSGLYALLSDAGSVFAFGVTASSAWRRAT